MSYLEGLNERQKEAVLHVQGPLLIIAGAGAGKTKTITHRIAHLIHTGVPGHRILAVTFTNKAAGEMRERVRRLLEQGDPLRPFDKTQGRHEGSEGRPAQGKPLVATFHSLGVRILREFSGRAGVPRSFTIWDREDSLRALKRILDEEDDPLPPRAALSRISRAKGEGLAPKEYEAGARNFRERDVARVWEKYEKALESEGALDFDDLLSRTLTLLRRSEDVRSLLQARWSHVTIDEYQDTNAAQYEIARLLAGDARNICVVGDIDQNIYSWRGADIEHLLQFEDTFPGTKVVTLEQNYRSTSTILSAANAVIEKNKRRKPKRLFTEKETGEAIALYGAQNEIDEAYFVAAKAAELMEQGTPPGGIAVLYRENFQSRAIEEALLHFGIPYRVLGTRFFERKEVKDVLSYVRAAHNPKSRSDIVRIIGTPARGIGKITADKMLAGLEADLPNAARAKVAAFRLILAHIAAGIATLPASEAVRYAFEESGMEKMFGKMLEEGKERAENVQELVNFATRFDHAQPPEGIEQLLEEAALQSEQDQLADREDAVALMTVHASKGLEFDAVFITGLEQGLFPWTREDESRDPEEERRLFYVALTRAKRRLFLSYASSRMKYGSREFTVPSEFLEDIDPRLLEYAKPEAGNNHEEIIR